MIWHLLLLLSKFPPWSSAASPTNSAHIRRGLNHHANVAARQLQDNPRLSLVEVCMQLPTLSLTEAYLVLEGADSEIDGPGPFAFFPPWNYAWDALDQRLAGRLQDPTHAWSPHLRDLLLYHMVDGEFAPENLADTQTIPTKSGDSVVITREPGTASRYYINDILVLATYDATNGHAYMLDHVLPRPWFATTVYDIAISTFSSFASLMVAAELEDILGNPDEVVTLFVPTNDAFDASFNLLPQDEARLQDLVRLHIVPGGPIPSLSFESASLTTLEGSTLQMIPASPTRLQGMVNEASIIETDILAYNGLVHAINSVLLLDDESPCDTCFVELDVSCHLSDPIHNGLPCDQYWYMLGHPQCGNEINSLSFTYYPATCVETANGNPQGPLAACADLAPLHDDPVHIYCSDGTSNGVSLTTSPAAVSPGEQVHLGTMNDGTLPAVIKCTLAGADDEREIFQRIQFSVGGSDENLALKDTFGSLVLEACDDQRCLEEVVVTHTVTNVGDTNMEVLDVTSTISEQGEVVTTSLVHQVTPNPLPSQQSSEVHHSVVLDYCGEHFGTFIEMMVFLDGYVVGRPYGSSSGTTVECSDETEYIVSIHADCFDYDCQ